ncbi:MAG TPA: hypothetical protein VIV61_06680 [Candidatus Ozemobacteraceae bacterium]
MNGATPRLKGYLILILALFVFTMWGVNLFSLSQIEVDTPDPSGRPKTSAGGGSSTRVVQVRPRPFLYFYFYELGYTLYVTDAVPQDQRGAMLMIDPPDRLPAGFLRNLAEWIGRGGSLFVLTTRPHAILTQAGVEPKSVGEGSPLSRLALTLPWMDDARVIETGGAGWTPLPGRSFLRPYLPGVPGIDPVLLSGWGSGRLCIAASSELTTAAGLRRSDNLVLLTRLIERLSPAKQVYFFDPEPNRRLRAVVASSGSGSGKTPMGKKKIPYLSLWSLMKANPVSWALLQLILALAVFGFSIGRRFGPILPVPAETPEQTPFITGVARLLQSRAVVSFAAGRALTQFLPPALRRFGLPSDAPTERLVESLNAIRPDLGERLGGALNALVRLRDAGLSDDEARLLHALQTLAQIRKELRIHG